MEVFLITTKMSFEFQDGSFTSWSADSNLYAYLSIEEAKKGIQGLKEEEVQKYKEWLKNSKSCFIHHTFDIKIITVYKE